MIESLFQKTESINLESIRITVSTWLSSHSNDIWWMLISPIDILRANTPERLQTWSRYEPVQRHDAARTVAGIKYLKLFKSDWENELNELRMNPESIGAGSIRTSQEWEERIDFER